MAHARAALEIVDSRVAGWNVAITDTIADNASSGLYVLGDEPVSLEAFNPCEVQMKLFVDERLASEGDGVACLGDPLAALHWLARTAQALGDPLRAGQIVLSGALGALAPVGAGDTVRAELTCLGEVRARFSDKERA